MAPWQLLNSKSFDTYVDHIIPIACPPVSRDDRLAQAANVQGLTKTRSQSQERRRKKK